MEWEQLGHHLIDNVIRQWRRRLRGCVNADGGQFILCDILTTTMDVIRFLSV